MLLTEPSTSFTHSNASPLSPSEMTEAFFISAEKDEKHAPMNINRKTNACLMIFQFNG
jgi:hypothetical protein